MTVSRDNEGLENIHSEENKVIEKKTKSDFKSYLSSLECFN